MSLASQLRALRDQCDSGAITQQQFEVRRRAVIASTVEAIDFKYYPRNDGVFIRLVEGTVSDHWRTDKAQWVVVGEILVRFGIKANVSCDVGDRLVAVGRPTAQGFSAIAYRNETSGFNGAPEGRRLVSKFTYGSAALIAAAFLLLWAAVSQLVAPDYGWTVRLAIAVAAVTGAAFALIAGTGAGAVAWAISIHIDALEERVPRPNTRQP